MKNSNITFRLFIVILLAVSIFGCADGENPMTGNENGSPMDKLAGNYTFDRIEYNIEGTVIAIEAPVIKGSLNIRNSGSFTLNFESEEHSDFNTNTSGSWSATDSTITLEDVEQENYTYTFDGTFLEWSTSISIGDLEIIGTFKWRKLS
ncbi:hypothetical protein F4X73_13635 [Candidatus Poribacteria bacterium]|nr:hypothetical protein [Candidatus Poribacteria bacterium]